jgi:hypothetical protein
MVGKHHERNSCGIFRQIGVVQVVATKSSDPGKHESSKTGAGWGIWLAAAQGFGTPTAHNVTVTSTKIANAMRMSHLRAATRCAGDRNDEGASAYLNSPVWSRAASLTTWPWDPC